MLVEEENKESKAVGRHPDLRRRGPPAFPHRKPPSVSQNLERGKEGCVGGGERQMATPEAGGNDGAARREA